MDTKILDCTIRDGGYLNNWKFEDEVVRELYKSISKSGIDIIELGFRSSEKYFNPNQYGIWRFTPEHVIEEANKNISGSQISLMVDFGKIDIEDIPAKSDSCVDLYRVASNKDKVLAGLELCDNIKDKGYITSIQLMGIVNYTESDFIKINKALESSHVDYVYFADSYGSLLPSDIKDMINRLSPSEKKIGFHAHNNLQLAFANTLEAIKNKVSIVDGTIFGMGRGAGNLPIEALISYLERTLNNKKYNVLPILDLIDRYFYSLHRSLQWGYGLPYMLSGIFKLHPYYSKTMIDYREFTIDDIWKALEIVREINPIGFNEEVMQSIINSGFVGSSISTRTYDESEEHNDFLKKIDKIRVLYLDRHIGKDFLILANGPTLKEHKKKIDYFIEKTNPIIMGANFLGGLYVPDYHAFSNKKRFLNYVNTVDNKSKLLISNTFQDNFIKEYKNPDKDYEMIIHSPELTDFDIINGVILSNCRTISVLLIAVAAVMGAKRIFIAGMDGYKDSTHYSTHFYKEQGESEDVRLLTEKHDWNERLLKQIDKYLTKNNKEGLNIITPTSHKMFYKGIDNYI